ncbi:restriction endonuclease subunit S [Pseudomaricurvus alcaniphilus]|uniref:restriction endonuclease subunit S n=1 Tax=Pseudomaricurvus alcaniphilus TaxID=1166482 RepID=UPI0014085773|nr:restriction endonuclease subunit S [Pseudomaricurvus alcaniphilus]NHN36904.1 restriction endonuclease subunit S [Pseudomaricurvus alcaniphilus]
MTATHRPASPGATLQVGSAGPQGLITDHIDLWTSAIKTRSTTGRGSSNKRELYGIKKLRELILELAVRGKLVPQDPSDEPASVLLEQIGAKKAALIKQGKIKKQKPLPPVSREEKPFDLPEGWEWIKLGEIVEMHNGRAFKSTEWGDEGLPIVRIQNLNNELAEFNYFAGELAEKNRIDNGSFLISWSGTPGTSFGAFIWNRGPAALNQHINNCIFHSDEIYLEFMQLAVSGCMNHFISMAQGAVGLKHVTKGTLNNAVIAFPPLIEQHRIVAKVDELMALCDQLEQQTETSLDAHQQLVDTLLATLTDARDAEELNDNWTRLAAHFDTLITTDYAVEQLKQTILQLAVMGKLVPQDTNNEPASKLLERIAAEKAQLVKQGKIKKQKPLPPIGEEEKPFKLMIGWEWARLGEISRLMSGKGFKKSEYSESGAKLFQIANVSIGYTKWDVRNYMPLSYLDEYPELELSPGDVLIALNRPLLNKRMKVCILTDDDMPSILYQRVGKFDFYKKTLNTKYFFYFMQSALFIEHLNENLQGSDQPFINQSQLVNFIFPCPPLIEQNRIVSMVDELMALCDKLKACLSDAQAVQLQLTNALADQAIM